LYDFYVKRGIFDRKKAINSLTLAGQLMARSEGSKGIKSFETFFFFYRISLKKSIPKESAYA